MAKKNKRALIIVASAVLLITVITVAYAYFVATVQTVNEQTVVSEAGTMRLVMNDGNTGWSEVWDFGESKTKTFTLQNTGTLPVTVDLYWKNLVNTFLSGSMVYSLKQTTDTSVETYLVGTSSTFENIPTSSTAVSTNKIAEEITVPANKTYTYTLTIKLVNSETVDQTSDFNATFYTEFNIQEFVPPTIANPIAFTLSENGGSPKTYYAISGMTFDEWLESEYNTIFTKSGTTIFVQGPTCIGTVSSFPTGTITANQNYNYAAGYNCGGAVK